jgi:hypothetical protein
MASDIEKSPVTADLAERWRREGKCVVCGRKAEAGWTLCPSCGAALDQDYAADEEEIEASGALWVDALSDYEPKNPGQHLALFFLRSVGGLLLLVGGAGWLAGTLATCVSSGNPSKWPAYAGFGVALTWLFLVCAGCLAAGALLLKLDSAARKRLALEAGAYRIEEAAERKDTYVLMRLSYAYEGRSDRLEEIGTALQEIVPQLDAEKDHDELAVAANALDCPELELARTRARAALGWRLSDGGRQDRTRVTAPRDRPQTVVPQDDGALTENEGESESEGADEIGDGSRDPHWGEELDWGSGDDVSSSLGSAGDHSWDHDFDGDGDGDGDGD